MPEGRNADIYLRSIINDAGYKDQPFEAQPNFVYSGRGPSHTSRHVLLAMNGCGETDVLRTGLRLSGQRPTCALHTVSSGLHVHPAVVARDLSAVRLASKLTATGSYRYSSRSSSPPPQGTRQAYSRRSRAKQEEVYDRRGAKREFLGERREVRAGMVVLFGY